MFGVYGLGKVIPSSRFDAFIAIEFALEKFDAIQTRQTYDVRWGIL